MTLNQWQERLMESPRYKWWVLIVIQFGIFFVGVIGTIVNIALPTISTAFSSSISQSQWIIIVYSVTIAGFLPITGKLPQYLGCKKIILFGFALFTLSVFLCALATSLTFLIILQIPMAIGSAALLANSNAIIYKVFPRHQHGFSMGINVTVVSIGYGVGLLAGGYLIEKFGWPAIFWLNFPIGLIAILLGMLIFVEKKISIHEKKKGHFDYGGALLFVVSIACFLLSMNFQLRSQSLYFLFGGLVMLGGFLIWEWKVPFPMLKLDLFKISSFSIGSSTRLLITSISNSCLFLIPFYTQINLGLSPSQSGLAMASFSLALFILGPIGGKLSDKFGAKSITTLGFVACGFALLTMIALSKFQSIEVSISLTIVGMFFLGIGIGIFVPSNNNMTLKAVPPTEVGVVSGFLWSMAYLGIALGTSFSALVVTHKAESLGASFNIKEKLKSAFLSQMFSSAQTMIFEYLLIICALGIILCLLRKKTSSN